MTGIESAKCPVVHFECSPPRSPTGESFFPRLDELRREYPIFRSDEAQGYWVFTRAELIAEAMQDPQTFSSSASVPPTIPDPPYKWIPLMLDPPEHNKWRRLLGGWFSPGRVESLESGVRERCRSLIADFVSEGKCDFVDDFAAKFPTSVFLQILGLPPSELEKYMVWEKAILQPDAESDPGFVKMTRAITDVQDYFQTVIDRRRTDESSRGQDIITAAIDWQIDGEAIPDGDLKNCLLLLFMAGLDTMTSQLSFIFRYLADHPQDRKLLAEDASLIPRAVEELLRFYTITRAGRKVAKDTEFHGYSLKAGDMVYLPLAFAGRDEDVHENALEVHLDRPAFRNLAFGAGPHRCLGAHLARRELIVAVEEWHARIPDYTVPDNAQVVEHSGQVYGLDNLPLEWNVER